MQPGQEITATLSTVTDFSEITSIQQPTNARIYLLTNVDTPFEFEYDSTRSLYHIPPHIHRARNGFKYEIRAYLKDDPGQNEIFANTSFKTPYDIELLNSSLRGETNSEIHGVFKFNGNSTKYYKLTPHITLKGDNELINIIFLGNNEDPLAFFQNKHTNSIYIDVNRIDPTEFTMDFALPDGISYEQIVPSLEFSLEAITKDFYYYEVARLKQVATITSGNSEPVINYSNVTNGHGVFGTSFRKKLSIPLGR